MFKWMIGSGRARFAAIKTEGSEPLHGFSSHRLLLTQEPNRFDRILSAPYIAFVTSEPNMVLDASHFWRFMKYIGVITAAVLGAAVSTPALAGSATQNPEWLTRQKACKKEASAQGLHMSKKRA